MSWTSPLTALPHLSDEAVAAFADGVLGDTARQRAQSHMAGCAECSDAVYGQRAARAALRAAGRPTLPDSLFERLRELPITAELPTLNVALALSADGQPLFSTFTAPITELAMAGLPPSRPVPMPVAERQDSTHQRPEPHPTEIHPFVPQPSGVPLAAPRPSVLGGHRHTSTRVGLGATAAAVLAVGVLVTTAANAGGVSPTTRVVQPAVTDRSPAPAVRAPMQMTLLSVPSSGR